MFGYVITSTMTEANGQSKKVVYMKEVHSSGKFGGIYAQWTERISEAKFFDRVSDAEEYSKGSIGHSLDWYMSQGKIIDSNLLIQMVSPSLYPISGFHVGDYYRRPR